MVKFIPDIDVSEGSYLDLQILRIKWKNELNPAEHEVSNSLANLTEICFHKPHDKRETLSIWWNRPLRRAQKLYAALDAYVIVKIIEFVQEKMDDNEFVELINRCCPKF